MAAKVKISKKTNILVLTGDKEKVIEDLQSLEFVMKAVAGMIQKPSDLMGYFSKDESQKDIDQIISSTSEKDVLELRDVFALIKGKNSKDFDYCFKN